MRQSLTRREAQGGYEFDPWLADIRARTGLCELMAGHRQQAQTLAILERDAFEGQPGVSPCDKQFWSEFGRRLGQTSPRAFS